MKTPDRLTATEIWRMQQQLDAAVRMDPGDILNTTLFVVADHRDIIVTEFLTYFDAYEAARAALKADFFANCYMLCGTKWYVHELTQKGGTGEREVGKAAVPAEVKLAAMLLS